MPEREVPKINDVCPVSINHALSIRDLWDKQDIADKNIQTIFSTLKDIGMSLNQFQTSFNDLEKDNEVQKTHLDNLQMLVEKTNELVGSALHNQKTVAVIGAEIKNIEIKIVELSNYVNVNEKRIPQEIKLLESQIEAMFQKTSNAFKDQEFRREIYQHTEGIVFNAESRITKVVEKAVSLMEKKMDDHLKEVDDKLEPMMESADHIKQARWLMAGVISLIGMSVATLMNIPLSFWDKVFQIFFKI